MKSLTAIVALIGFAFAASSSNAFAQSGVPGTPHTKPNKVATPPPPPPPPGGPDKYTTQTRPPGPGSGLPTGPKPVDDFAPDPNTQPSTCYANLGVAYGNCIMSLVTICANRGGTISYNDSSFTCTTN